jgi:hypothetical protein
LRTLVDIPDDDIDKLDALAVRAGRSRAAEIREAVKAHLLRKSSQDWIARGAGYWQGRADLPGSDA